VDPTRASVARIYNYLLGGKEHYAIDRQTAAEIAEAMPEVKGLAVENRAFLVRAVRFLAKEADVHQFLDCGSGLPTADNVHQVAQRFVPETKVVYVDHDPVVIAHGQALLEEDEQTRFVEGDIFAPRTILDHQVVRDHLDWTRPIALLQVATLHHHKGGRHEPAEMMRQYIDALPSGSYVVLSHIFDPEGDDTPTMRALEDAVARGSLGGATARTRAEIQELFGGLDLIEPGIVELVKWWPDGPSLKPFNVAQRLIVGGIGYKP
jgi:hypothetical protein